MFKSFKRKVIAALCVLVLVASYPAPVFANPAGGAAFTAFSVNRTTVTQGQDVTFTIRTSGASSLFASVNEQWVRGSMQSIDQATGQSNWLLTVTPQTSTVIHVHANTVEQLEGAAVVSIPITVNAAGGAVAQPGNVGQGAQGHQIISITEIEATAANEVSLSIVTNDTPREVWIVVSAAGGDRFHRAVVVSQGDGRITWRVNYRPPTFTPHTVAVFANELYQLNGLEVTQSFNVNLVAPFIPPVNPAIINVSARPTNIDYRDTSTITVRTNTDVEYVWAYVDGRRVNARRGAFAATQRTFTLDVRPDSTQTIRIYANSTNSSEGANHDSVRITVRDRRSDPRIDSVNLSHTNIRPGEMTTIEVRTNADTEHVWVVVEGIRVNLQRGASTSTTRNWSANIWPGRSESIRVYAGRTSTDSDADRSSIWINVGN